MVDSRTSSYLFNSARNSNRSHLEHAARWLDRFLDQVGKLLFTRRSTVIPWTNMTEDSSSFQQNGTDYDDENTSLANLINMENPSEMLDPWVRNPHLPYIVLGHIVVGLFGIFGNLLVIFVMISDKKTHNATTHLFLRSLAFADLLLLAVCTPLEIYQYFAFQWDEHGIICKLASFAEFLSAISSILNMVAVTVERFIVIVFPLKSRIVCTINNCRRSVVFVWLLACFLAVPVLMTKGTFTMVYYNNETSVHIHYCNDVEDSFARHFAIYQLMLLFILPGTIMTLCYAYVIRELWKSTKNMQMLTNNDATDSRKKKTKNALSCKEQLVTEPTMKLETEGRKVKSECESCPDDIVERSNEGGNVDGTLDGITKGDAKKGHLVNEAKSSIESPSKRFDEVKTARKQVIKMLIMVVSLFVLCWGPKIVMVVLIKYRVLDFSLYVYTVRVVVNFLPFMHACINPCIYCIMSKNFHLCVFRQIDKMRCNKRNSSLTCATRSRERGGMQVSSSRQCRRRESTTSLRLFQIHRGSTTTSSTNMNVTEITRQTPDEKHEEGLVKKVDINRDKNLKAKYDTFDDEETAL